MDSLTQIVLGAAVGEAVLGKKVGNRAMLWGAIGGTIPDLDVFYKYFYDPITTIELHRGFSHSLVFCIVMAPILGWIANKIHSRREVGIKPWSWLFFWALVTHPLLDAHTVWGTQFFWPFEYRLAYKNIFVVDPLYTLPFLIFLLIAMFHKRTNPRRRLFNNLGLIVSSAYMLLTLGLKWITYQKFESQLAKENIEYIDIENKTTPLNTVLWNAQIQSKTGFRVAYYSFFDSKEISISEEMPHNHHLLEPIKNEKVVQQLLKISTGWYMVEKIGERLFFIDLRFGQLGVDHTSPFLWRFEILKDAHGGYYAERVPPDFSNKTIGDALSELGERMKGN